MKSKAHFKKCSELGISPIPTMPDEDMNDFEDSGSYRNRDSSSNGRENDSRGDSETDDNDSDDDDDESGDGKQFFFLLSATEK
jgi:human immunodeficiency virus type I enhancer-binding protein